MNTFAKNVMERMRRNEEVKKAAHDKLVRDICSITDPELREELMSAYGIPEKSAIVAVAAA